MNKFTTVLLAGTAAIAMTACGGGGSGNTGGGTQQPPANNPQPPANNPQPPEETFYTLNDLEFSTLNFTEYWHAINDYTYDNINFTNEYLVDSEERTHIMGVDTSIREGCTIAPPELGTTYMCLKLYDSGAIVGYAIDINSDRNIYGLAEYSNTGDVYEIAEGIMDSNLADMWVTGNLINYYADTGNSRVKSITVENKNEIKLNFDSNSPQEVKKQSTTDNNVSMAFEKLYDDLLSNK